MRLAAALAVLVTLAAPARADHDRRAAAAHFQEGSALYAQARFSEALAEFEAGYQAYPLRGFLVNIGQCYRKLDQLDEAADAWRRFLATNPADAKLRDEVTDALAEVAALQAKNAQPPTTTATPAPEVAPAPVEPAVNLDPPAPAPAVAADVITAPLIAKPVEKKKSRRWVWAVVGVTVASLAAVAVTVGVMEWPGATPRSGSLGLIDGRR